MDYDNFKEMLGLDNIDENLNNYLKDLYLASDNIRNNLKSILIDDRKAELIEIINAKRRLEEEKMIR